MQGDNMGNQDPPRRLISHQLELVEKEIAEWPQWMRKLFGIEDEESEDETT